MILKKMRWIGLGAMCVLCLPRVVSAQGALDVQTLSVEGATLEYVDTGSGEPTVFVHGAISDLRAWDDYIVTMAENHRFIAYTRRFYGSQPLPETQFYDHAVHAEDLASLIRAVDAGPVHLVTWSSGAYSASIVAAKYPELIKSMVHFEPITSSAMMDEVPNYKSASDEWDARWGGVGDQLDAGDLRHALRKFVEVIFELPAGGFESLSKAHQQMFLINARTIPIMFSGETQIKTGCDYVSKIAAPTLVVLGTQTHRAWAMEVERMAECMPNATLSVMPGVKHSGPITDRDNFVKLIKNFVSENR